MTSWQWLFEHACILIISALPDPSWILWPWTKSPSGHSSCLITSSSFDRCCFLWFFSSHRNLFRCTANSTWYYSCLLFGDRSGTPGGKNAWSWFPQPEHEEEVCLPHELTGGVESRVAKKSLGLVMLIIDLHFIGASQITVHINTKKM